MKICGVCTLENAPDASACVACESWWCPRCTLSVSTGSATCVACGYPDDEAPAGPDRADADSPVATSAADDGEALAFASAAAAPPAFSAAAVAAGYRPRRVEKALLAAPRAEVARIVDDPGAFVAAACGATAARVELRPAKRARAS